MDGFLEKFKNSLTGSNCTLLLCHDFPDPDCLASAFGLQFLLKHWKIKSVITYGGFIGRAENKALVQKLGIEAVPINGLDLSDFDRVVFVDTQPGSGNHSLPKSFRRDCAIDHHPIRLEADKLSAYDIAPEMGATSTLVTQYLRKKKLEINYKIATALYYGLKTDTRDLALETTPEDREVYYFLFNRVDHGLLSEIEHPNLDRDFFDAITKAFNNLETKDKNGWCFLNKISRPDIVAEMADLFIRMDDVDYIICLGFLRDVLYFSIRTREVELEAGEIAQKIVKGFKGSAGGHGQMAAGRLEFSLESEKKLMVDLKKQYYKVMSEIKTTDT